MEEIVMRKTIDTIVSFMLQLFLGVGSIIWLLCIMTCVFTWKYDCNLWMTYILAWNIVAPTYIVVDIGIELYYKIKYKLWIKSKKNEAAV